MIRNIQRTWFEVWGNEQAQNQILKGLLTLTICLCLAETIGLTVLALKKPVLIAVSFDKSQVLAVELPPQDYVRAEIKRVASGYLNSHYNWDWQKIEGSIGAAAKYVHPDFVKRFEDANAEQIKIAKEKKVAQRFYIHNLTVNGNKVHVEADRIILVENLRATNPLIIDLDFNLGARTESNPEGVYITGEKVTSQQNN